MQDRARTYNLICPGLVVDLKKVYNISGHTAIKTRETMDKFDWFRLSVK
jgi:hypothetical protein